MLILSPFNSGCGPTFESLSHKNALCQVLSNRQWSGEEDENVKSVTYRRTTYVCWCLFMHVSSWWGTMAVSVRKALSRKFGSELTRDLFTCCRPGVLSYTCQYVEGRYENHYVLHVKEFDRNSVACSSSFRPSFCLSICLSIYSIVL